MNILEDVDLQMLRQLDLDPKVNQRGLAERLGLSVGKANYCLRGLVGKGLVKISNFRRSDNKLAYVYLLTPMGLQEKTRLTVAFLKRRQLEYERLQVEIALLKAEVEALASENSPSATSDAANRTAR